jgi:hypothetical protein
MEVSLSSDVHAKVGYSLGARIIRLVISPVGSALFHSLVPYVKVYWWLIIRIMHYA